MVVTPSKGCFTLCSSVTIITGTVAHVSIITRTASVYGRAHGSLTRLGFWFGSR